MKNLPIEVSRLRQDLQRERHELLGKTEQYTEECFEIPGYKAAVECLARAIRDGELEKIKEWSDDHDAIQPPEIRLAYQRIAEIDQELHGWRPNQPFTAGRFCHERY